MKKNVTALIISLVMALSILTGCGAHEVRQKDGTKKQEEVHVAIILGSHNNAPRLNLKLVQDSVNQACSTYGKVTLVCDDGNPYTTVIDIPKQQSSLSKSKYKEIAEDQTSQILKAAGQIQAKTAEVDTLRAIQEGARSLASAKTEIKGAKLVRHLILLDSCVSTTGVFSLLDHNLNELSSKDIVSQLEERNAIPLLNDVQVTVYNCGDTAGEKQKKLNEANRKALQDVWKSILQAGNAAEVNIKDDLPLSDTYDEDTLPVVSPVTVIEEAVDIQDSADMKEAFADGGMISFDEKTIAFSKGSAQLADRAAAKSALTYVAGYMDSHPDFQLLVCGTTACWGGEEYCKNLSDDRAEEVCRLLTEEFGISKSRLKSVGVGYSCSEFYTYDQTPDGKLDEKVAPLNRSVKMVDLNTDTAFRILSTI